MKTKTCSRCHTTQPFEAFTKCSTSKGGRRGTCLKCTAAAKRKYNRDPNRRVCPSCRRAKDITEPPGKCSPCIISHNLTRLTASLPSRAGRPGCVVYGSVCQVLDEANERWVEMPAVNCKTCGVDQHLEECLDCTAPIGQGDKQKSVRALRQCAGCSEWTPNVRCPGCVL